jgi:hypothetical protein
VALEKANHEKDAKIETLEAKLSEMEEQQARQADLLAELLDRTGKGVGEMNGREFLNNGTSSRAGSQTGSEKQAAPSKRRGLGSFFDIFGSPST